MSTSKQEKHKLFVICGPTAVGKTALSIALAEKYNTEIISADSRQFYKEMDAGTAKPSARELIAVKHHFINSLSIHQEYSAGQYERDALAILDKLFTRHQVVFAVGGSGLYLKALTEGLNDFPDIPQHIVDSLNDEVQIDGLGNLALELSERDPEYFAIVDKDNPHRVIRALSVIRATGQTFSSFRVADPMERPFDIHYIRLGLDREALYARINNRVNDFLDNGLIEECRLLYPYRNLKSLQTVGYTEVFDYFNGLYPSLEVAIDKIRQHTRNYAKRQETWLRKHVQEPIYSPLQKDRIVEEVALILND